MKYAFLVMGSYDSRTDRAEIQNGATRIIGVSSVEEACEIARGLQAEGVGPASSCAAPLARREPAGSLTPQAEPWLWATWSTSPSRTDFSRLYSAEQ